MLMVLTHDTHTQAKGVDVRKMGLEGSEIQLKQQYDKGYFDEEESERFSLVSEEMMKPSVIQSAPQKSITMEDLATSMMAPRLQIPAPTGKEVDDDAVVQLVNPVMELIANRKREEDVCQRLRGGRHCNKVL